MFAYFDRFELRITAADAAYGSHQGTCDQEIAELVDRPYIRRQLAKIDPESIRKELSEYGAWDATELTDDNENRARILWIACGDINESAAQRHNPNWRI